MIVLQTRFAVLACAAALALGASTALGTDTKSDAVDRVNSYIGTGSGKIGYGGTMPFVTPPFGMIDWTPQTRQNKLRNPCAGI